MSGWRDFPSRLAARTGLGAVVYSRRGYGRSAPLAEPFAPDFMHREAREDLPALLAALDIEEPLLVGHSDGGSIALIHASEKPASEAPVAGLVLLAPHVFVEDVTVKSIAALRAKLGDADLVARFEKHHGANARPLLHAWTGAWLDPRFREWSIEEKLAAVTCPVLVLQGADDEYGTLEQVRRIERGVRGPCETLVLEKCGHSPQRDAPDAVLERIARFVRERGLDR